MIHPIYPPIIRRSTYPSTIRYSPQITMHAFWLSPKNTKNKIFVLPPFFPRLSAALLSLDYPLLLQNYSGKRVKVYFSILIFIEKMRKETVSVVSLTAAPNRAIIGLFSVFHYIYRTFTPCLFCLNLQIA